MTEGKCPICDSQAKYKKAPFGTSNYIYSCETCTDFIISPEAIKIITESPYKNHTAMSEKCRSSKNQELLLITVNTKNNKKTISTKYENEGKWR